MTERKYNVVFKGEIHEQASLSLVQERLASIFKADIKNIELMFFRKRTIVKKNVSYELCQKVEQGFLNAGAYVDIEEIIPEVSTPETIEPIPESGYTSDYEYASEPESEYAPEEEIEYVSETEYPPESESEYASETEYPPESENEYASETEYLPESETEYMPDPEYISEPESESEIVQPLQESEEYDPEFESDNEESEEVYESVESDGALQSLEMKNRLKEVVPEPDEDIDEPLFESTPLPDHMTDSGSDPELEPEFKIVEDELESGFEMIEDEPQHDSDYNEEYEFDKIESGDIEDDDFFENESLENLYAAPYADLEQDRPGDGNFVYAQKRPFKSGLSWLVNGFLLFKEKPVPWIVSVFVFGLISIIMSIIPFIGSIIANILNPVFLAGFMLGAKEQDEGGSLRIGHVFAGFSNNFGQLILFGLLYFVTILLIFGLIGVVFVLIFVAGGLGAMNFADPSSFAALAKMSPLIFLLIFLVIMLITVPIMMAYYFGPALIAINQETIFDAIKMSFRACLSNVLPFLMYGLACMGGFIVVGAVVVGIIALLGMLFKEIGFIIGAIVVIIMMLAIMPIFFASTYAAYKDIFYTK